MPSREVSVMEQRRELVKLPQQEDVNRRELFRRFGISPPVGCKGLARFACGCAADLGLPPPLWLGENRHSDLRGSSGHPVFLLIETDHPARHNGRRVQSIDLSRHSDLPT
jgi:hypothetical protein